MWASTDCLALQSVTVSQCQCGVSSHHVKLSLTPHGRPWPILTDRGHTDYQAPTPRQDSGGKIRRRRRQRDRETERQTNIEYFCFVKIFSVELSSPVQSCPERGRWSTGNTRQSGNIETFRLEIFLSNIFLLRLTWPGLSSALSYWDASAGQM